MIHEFLVTAGYLSEFTRSQLEALALGLLGVRSGATSLAMAFWGLWLFPFGILVIRSEFIPKPIGFLLLVAGFAYLTSAATAILLPDYRQMVSRVMMPLYFGEIPIIFWLLIVGVRVRKQECRPDCTG